MPEGNASPESAIQDALCRHDAAEVSRLLRNHAELRERINQPLFSFNSPAIVAYADDAAMVDVLLEAGADPNRRSEWWAGGFHALYSATGDAAVRLITAGAVMDACAAAHLDRADVLKEMISADPARVHERGGDGQTPLHFAVSQAVIDVLLDAGADINARDVDHRSTPAEWMLDRRRGAGRYELARYLAARGAATDIFLAAALGLTDRARALLQADSGLLNLRTGRGEYGEKPPSSYHIYFWTIGDGLTALDVAAQFDHRETLDAMMGFASISQRLLAACRQGDEALAREIVREHPGIVASLTQDEQRVIADAAWNGNARAVALMLDLGFDPKVSGQDSGTPLHLAAWEGSAETVAVILRHPDASTLLALRDAHHGGTPLGWCCHGSLHGNRSHDHAGVARLLLAAGAVPGDNTGEASPAVRAVIGAAGRV
jgi:ankyrin repeat protein